ncbi:MAG: 1-phosphofructokinase family hexose kinase [Chitinophagaceae bacterium]|nr:1-phosphofructokinase family hexose kinase [Chitinophagaceae bacterium]
MHQIITITLNPSLDKTTSVQKLLPAKKLRCAEAILEPGGGGINVSRVLKKLGSNSLAVYLSGGYTGKQFDQLLQEEKVDGHIIPIKNTIRENLIVLDEDSNLQYRFGMDGPLVYQDEWQQCLQFLQKQSGHHYVVASGSLPPGVPVDFFAQLADILKQQDAKLIIDTSGKALASAVKEGVFMIKPNLHELSNLYGVAALKNDEIIDAAKTIITKGGCEVMAVSLGAEGAILITKDDVVQVKSPKVNTKSTVGAGDSMVAGMVLAMTQKKTWKQVLQMGIACGSAATMNNGAELCRKEDVTMLLAQIQQQ